MVYTRFYFWEKSGCLLNEQEVNSVTYFMFGENIIIAK